VKHLISPFFKYQTNKQTKIEGVAAPRQQAGSSLGSPFKLFTTYFALHMYNTPPALPLNAVQS
jgi:hypothetical protein